MFFKKFNPIAEVDRWAENLISELVKQPTEKTSITEQLNETNQMEWVRQMNAIHYHAQKIVYHEIIYSF